MYRVHTSDEQDTEIVVPIVSVPPIHVRAIGISIANVHKIAGRRTASFSGYASTTHECPDNIGTLCT